MCGHTPPPLSLFQTLEPIAPALLDVWTTVGMLQVAESSELNFWALTLLRMTQTDAVRVSSAGSNPQPRSFRDVLCQSVSCYLTMTIQTFLEANEVSHTRSSLFYFFFCTSRAFFLFLTKCFEPAAPPPPPPSL